jgi:hypothetical protein
VVQAIRVGSWWTCSCVFGISRDTTRWVANIIINWGWTGAGIAGSFVGWISSKCGVWAWACGIAAVAIGYAVDTLIHAGTQGRCLGEKVSWYGGWIVDDNGSACRHGQQ